MAFGRGGVCGCCWGAEGLAQETRRLSHSWSRCRDETAARTSGLGQQVLYRSREAACDAPTQGHPPMDTVTASSCGCCEFENLKRREQARQHCQRTPGATVPAAPTPASLNLPRASWSSGGAVRKRCKIKEHFITPSAHEISGRKQLLSETLGIHFTCATKKKKNKKINNPHSFQRFRLSPSPLSSIPGSWHCGRRKEMPLWDAGGLEDLLFPARWMEA